MIVLIYRSFLSFICLSYLKLVYFRKLKIKYSIGFHFSTKVIIRGKSNVSLISVNTEDNVLIKATNSHLFIENCFINRNTSIVSRESIKIGKNVSIGPNCCIYDHDHDYKIGSGYITKPINIGDNVWIGANVVILKGVQIGEHSVVAAGSVVTKSVTSHTLVAGNPATKIKDIL